MHDRNGTELRHGDIVLVPARITELNGGEEFCNVSLESTDGRRPDGIKETIHGINTGVCVLLQRAEAVQKGAG